MRRFLIILLLCSSAFGQWQSGVKPMLGIQVDWASLSSKGLVGLWLFNEGSGNKVFDLSGNGNTGTLVADTYWVAGKFGSALAFDGTEDGVDFGNAKTFNFGTGDFTLTVWIYLKALNSYQTILAKNTYNDDFQWRIQNTNEQRMYITGSAIGATTLSVNTWYFVACTRTNGIVQLYLNGLVDGNPLNLNLSIDNTNSLLMGTRVSSGHPFNGLIDYLTAYNRALSASEIAELYLRPFGMFVKDDIVILATAAEPPPPPSGQVITIQMSIISVIFALIFIRIKNGNKTI